MSKPGRQSAASLAVAQVSTDTRIAPPVGLSAPEKAVWVCVVNSRPADWFGDHNIADLKQYCRHAVQADIIAARIAEFDPGWLADDDGLKRYDKLLAMQDRETKVINAVARSLRLTNQSLIRAEKSVKGRSGRKPWESN